MGSNHSKSRTQNSKTSTSSKDYVPLSEKDEMIKELQIELGHANQEKIVVQKKASSQLFVCGISLTSGQLSNELFPDCTRSCFSQVVARRRGGDCIYEMRCLFVAVGPNACFIVLPHWDNMA